MAATKNKEVLYGLYDDDDQLVAAIKRAKAEHLDIMDVFTPFPMHAVDEAMEFEESRLHIAGFVFGATGTATAFGLMSWIFTYDWPIIFGGKPYWSVPAFIPITFEVTVLFAAIGMVVSFYTVCGLAPGVTNPYLDERITDDKFCIAFQTNGYTETEINNLKNFFETSGASEVNSKTI